MTLDDICEMFDNYIDGIYDPLVIDDLIVQASTILKDYAWKYDKLFNAYMINNNLVCAGDDYYIYTSFYDENEEK